ncbi:inositol monophosphatase [Thermovibrio ammonificans HB-1]|uniref:Inositol-1-monophosphatase n=1 Tax=Thermovibrio ammonificans (strain DSM 15698 / JCM 12110 / HB-1) TaxID=648996 RepID=E8T2Z0_THEA1|nr:inositol monophosphatase family protein [Thermovibrio ammonificans]ADU97199.1 inositol monophosphatase [Thermovibrio ammonificans HB-1]
MEKVIDVALLAAERASEVLLDYFGRLRELKVEEKARNDFVTEADKKSEMIIIKTIQESFPQHAIVAEESGSHGSGSWQWFIDPLDGTKNFIHGLPMFCVSIGVAYKGELVAAVVKAPLLEETFVAEKGAGAFCNGVKLKVSSRPFEEALVATGFPFRGKEMLDSYLKCFKEVFLSVSGLRRCGSAALDLAYTAKGVFDGFWEMSLHPWDIAAGILLVEEAGGVVTDFEGGRSFLSSGNIVGASPNTHGELLKIVQRHLT